MIAIIQASAPRVAGRIVAAVLVFAMACGLPSFAPPAFAAESNLPAKPESTSMLAPGIYWVSAHSYYIHPYTGAIEDRGQNPGIGQGMTESVLDKRALLEVDERGNYFLTVRFSLVDNMSDLAFSLQTPDLSAVPAGDTAAAEEAWAAAGYEDTAYLITREDMVDGEADICIAVPNFDMLIRCSAYVVPMGRDVVFYMGFDQPVAIDAATLEASDAGTGPGLEGFVTGEGSTVLRVNLVPETVDQVTAAVEKSAVPMVAVTMTDIHQTQFAQPLIILIVAAAIVLLAALGGLIFYRIKRKKLVA